MASNPQLTARAGSDAAHSRRQTRQSDELMPLFIGVSSTKVQRGKKVRRRSTITPHEFLRHAMAQLPRDLTIAEGIGILAGRVETKRRSLKSALIRQWLDERGVYSLPVTRNTTGRSLPRPTALLSYLNRSRVFPPLVSPDRSRPLCPLGDLFHELRHRGRQIDSLDLLAGAGLEWKTAAKVLAELTGLGLDETLVPAIAAARHFWTLYGEGRARFAALVEMDQLPLPTGDWAQFSATQISSLLPGVRLPDHCCRQEYFTHYRHGEDSLELYSTSWIALCQHRFPKRFNPLLFGSDWC